jgi:hypothetical protein
VFNPTSFTNNWHPLDFWETLQFIKQAATIRMEHTQNHDGVSALMTLINLVELDIHVQKSCTEIEFLVIE